MTSAPTRAACGSASRRLHRQMPAGGAASPPARCALRSIRASESAPPRAGCARLRRRRHRMRRQRPAAPVAPRRDAVRGPPNRRAARWASLGRGCWRAAAAGRPARPRVPPAQRSHRPAPQAWASARPRWREPAFALPCRPPRVHRDGGVARPAPAAAPAAAPTTRPSSARAGPDSRRRRRPATRARNAGRSSATRPRQCPTRAACRWLDPYSTTAGRGTSRPAGFQ